MEVKRVGGGIIFILAGLILILNSQVPTLGAVIGLSPVSSSISLIAGLVFLIVGILLFIGRRKGKLEQIKLINFPGNPQTYFKRRAEEIFDEKYNHQDIWISRWELDGIMDYIKNARTRKGKYIYSDSSFEHESDTPTKHTYQSDRPKTYGHASRGNVRLNIEHMDTEVEKDGEVIKRHMYITDDPNDPRLRYIGLNISKKDTAKRVKSNVYSQAHPTPDSQEYKRRIRVTYERGEKEAAEKDKAA